MQGYKRPGESQLSDKAKWKRAKYDPGQMHTVTQLLEQLEECSSDEKEAQQPQGEMVTSYTPPVVRLM